MLGCLPCVRHSRSTSDSGSSSGGADALKECDMTTKNGKALLTVLRSGVRRIDWGEGALEMGQHGHAESF